jgi:hypothetical protein
MENQDKLVQAGIDAMGKKESKHTPGPWKIDEAEDLPLGVIPDDLAIKMEAKIKALQAENKRLKEALNWLLDANPEMTVFTEQERNRLFGKSRSEMTGPEIRLLHACDIIDSQAKEIKKLSQYSKWHSGTRQNTIIAMKEIGKLYRKRGDEIKQLQAENKRLKDALRMIKAESYPGLAVKESTLLNRIYKCASQALKGDQHG